MISKVVLIIFMAGFKRGGIDHIDFPDMAQCMKAKTSLEAEYIENLSGPGRFDIKCSCIEVIK